MIVLDVNLLLYAYDQAAVEHQRARAHLEALFEGVETVGLPVQTVWAFLRIITHKNLPGRPVAMKDALVTVDAWLALPHVRLLSPGDRHWELLRDVLRSSDAHGPLTTDATLAAVTMEFGGVLETNDRDFARFPGLRWRNPLQDA